MKRPISLRPKNLRPKGRSVGQRLGYMATAGSVAFLMGLGPYTIAVAGFASLIPSFLNRTAAKRLSHDLALWLALAPLALLMHNSVTLALVLGPLVHLGIDASLGRGSTFLGISLGGHPFSRGKFLVITLLLAALWTGTGLLVRKLLPVYLAVNVGSSVKTLKIGIEPFLPLILAVPLSLVSFLAGTIPPKLRIFGKKTSGDAPVKKVTDILAQDETIEFSEIAKVWLKGEELKGKNNKKTTEPEPYGEVQEKKEPSSQTPSQTDTNPSFSPTGPRKELLQAAWNKLVIPYRKAFEESDVFTYVHELFELLDREGSIPSVRTDGADRFDRDHENQFDALTKISLTEHTVHVAELVVEKTLERYPDSYPAVLPRIFVAALAHDIGKLPSVSKKKYVTGQHPLDGAAFVEDLMTGHPWAPRIAELVRRHHERIVEDRTPIELMILIRADKEARARELKSVETDALVVNTKPECQSSISKVEIREIPKDFPIEKIPEKLEPFVNEYLENGVWRAFSQSDGTIFVQAELLHEIIADLASKHGFDDPFFHSTEKILKKSCLKSFYEEFRRRGWAVEKYLGKGFYGNYFCVYNPKKKSLTRTFYVPISSNAFGIEPERFEEKRKQHPILAAVKVYGVAPHQDSCDQFKKEGEEN